jgi:hypothetical protein
MDTEKFSDDWHRLLRDSDHHIRAIAAEARQYDTLAQLFPFASLSNLRFSRTSVYPYDLDLAYVLTRPDGSYEARGGDNRPLGSGSLEYVTRLVARAVTDALKGLPD